MYGVWYDNINKRWCFGFAKDPKLYLPDNSSRQSNIIKTTVTFGSLAVGSLAKALGTIPFTGVKVGDIVTIQPRTTPTVAIEHAWVATENIVWIQFANTIGAALSTGLMTLDVVASRFE